MLLHRFVAIEASDMMGKSVTSRLLAQKFTDAGLKATCVEPIRDNKLIRLMLKTGAALRWPNVFQFLQWFNRVLYEHFTLNKLIETHDVVIVDRWMLSAFVYGHCTNVWKWLLNLTSFKLRRPDVNIVLVGDKHLANKQLDSYERDNELQKEIDLEYELVLTFADLRETLEGRRNTYAVSASGSVEEVVNRILEKLEEVWYGTREGEEL